MPDGLAAFGGTNSFSQSLTALPAPPGREPLARPQTLRFSRKLYRYAKGPILEGAGIERSEMTGGVSSAAAEGISNRLHPGTPGGAPCGAQHLFFRLGELFQGGFPAQGGAFVRAAL